MRAQPAKLPGLVKSPGLARPAGLVRSASLVTVMAGVLALGACDWGPRGPGQLEGIVTSGGTAVGALVVEISGLGILGFSEVGQTRLLFAESGTDVYRVVLVAPDPAQIGFRVDVDDMRVEVPSVVVVEAVDDNNDPIVDLGAIAVEIRR